MAFTTTCIDTALGDLKLLQNTYGSAAKGLMRDVFGRGMRPLRILRTFILCARKLGNDMHARTDGNNTNKGGSLGSLLVRIEEAVGRNAKEIHPYCLSLEARSAKDVFHKILEFEGVIGPIQKEIEDRYIPLTDLLQQSVSPTIDEVMEITNSVLENLVDILSHFGGMERVLVMESLAEMMKFLKSFVRFATLRRVKRQQLQDFLNHIEDVAVNAAHLSFKCYYNAHDKEWCCKVLQPEISLLLRKIKPIDARIYATYTQALTSAKLSTQLHAPISDVDDDPIMIMKDFSYYLVSNLWEILQMDTYPVVSVKDQLQALHEGLRLSRTILVKQQNKFDENMKDFFGVLICDAGLIIFSLYQKDIKIDIELQDLLERIEQFQKQVEEKDPESSTFNFCRTNVGVPGQGKTSLATNELGFVDFLLENLIELASCEAYSNAQSQIQIIHDELVFLRSFLGETVELRNEQQELRTLWDRVMEVVCRVEFFH